MMPKTTSTPSALSILATSSPPVSWVMSSSPRARGQRLHRVCTGGCSRPTARVRGVATDQQTYSGDSAWMHCCG